MRSRHLQLVQVWMAGVALACATLFAPVAARAGSNRWRALGPDGGELAALALDPLHPGTIYAGGLYGAVFKSTNAGATWTDLGFLVPGGVVSLTVDPADLTTIYATGWGVFKSTDGGGSWRSLLETSNDYVIALAFDPSNRATLYAGTQGALLKTTDGGVRWTQILYPGVNVYALAVDPSHPATLYVGTEFGVVKTLNGGATWTGANLFLPVPFQALAIDPASSATVYAGGLYGVFKTTDGGVSWKAVNTGLPQFAGLGFLAIDPRDPETLYAGNGLWGSSTVNLGIFKTTNGGASWTSVAIADTWVYHLVIDPANTAVIYAGTPTGAWKTANDGASWGAVDSGLTAFRVNAMVTDPTSAATLYAGTDIDGILKSTDGGVTWSTINIGLGVAPRLGNYLAINALAIDPAHAATLYAGTDNGIFKSTDAGATWRAIDSGIPSPLPRTLALAIDPAHPATLFACTWEYGVLKSNDGGNSWKTVLPSDRYNPVLKLAIDATRTKTLYGAVEGGGVVKSSDGGSTWFGLAGLDAATAANPNKGVFDLVIDPTGGATLYVSTPSGVFRSTDGGATWAAVDCGLPEEGPGQYFIPALALDPQHPGTVYAWGQGMFKTADGGVSWGAVAAPSGIFVLSLVFDVRTSTLFAGTDGRGLYAVSHPHSRRPQCPAPAVPQ